MQTLGAVVLMYFVIAETYHLRYINTQLHISIQNLTLSARKHGFGKQAIEGLQGYRKRRFVGILGSFSFSLTLV